MLLNILIELVGVLTWFVDILNRSRFGNLCADLLIDFARFFNEFLASLDGHKVLLTLIGIWISFL